jgi:hypothetical protein
VARGVKCAVSGRGVRGAMSECGVGRVGVSGGGVRRAAVSDARMLDTRVAETRQARCQVRGGIRAAQRWCLVRVSAGVRHEVSAVVSGRRGGVGARCQAYGGISGARCQMCGVRRAVSGTVSGRGVRRVVSDTRCRDAGVRHAVSDARRARYQAHGGIKA